MKTPIHKSFSFYFFPNLMNDRKGGLTLLPANEVAPAKSHYELPHRTEFHQPSSTTVKILVTALITACNIILLN